MSGLSKLVRWLWLEVQLSSFPLVQDKAVPYLHRAKDAARLLLKPYLTTCQWQGQNAGGLLSVNYAGFGYAASPIKAKLFGEEPTVSKVRKVPVWQPGELVNSSGDIMIVEASKQLIRKLPDKSALTLPFQVNLVLDAQGGWEEVRHRFRSDARKNLRLVRKYGYDYDVSHDVQDFDMFYRTMYLPTLTDRYAGLASPTPIQEAYHYFRHGVLFLVKRDGQYVSGALCAVCGDVIDIRLLGVIDADRQLMKEGAQGAASYAIIHWANQQGYKYVEFGGCWPYLGGVFLYKRKWGSVAGIMPRHKNKRIWIRIQRDTPAVRQFFQNNPCVVIDKKGELHVLVVVDDPDSVTAQAEALLHTKYDTPGLSNILIRSIENLTDN